MSRKFKQNFMSTVNFLLKCPFAEIICIPKVSFRVSFYHFLSFSCQFLSVLLISCHFSSFPVIFLSFHVIFCRLKRQENFLSFLVKRKENFLSFLMNYNITVDQKIYRIFKFFSSNFRDTA